MVPLSDRSHGLAYSTLLSPLSPCLRQKERLNEAFALSAQGPVSSLNKFIPQFMEINTGVLFVIFMPRHLCNAACFL